MHPAEPLQPLCWPMARLGEALEELARRSGLAPADAAVADALLLPPALAGTQADAQARGRWLAWAAERLGIDSERVDASVPELATLLRHAAPVLLQLPGMGGPVLMAVLGRRGARLRVLRPDGGTATVPLQAVRDALAHRLESPLRPEVDRLLADVPLSAHRRQAASAALLTQRLAGERLVVGWILRPAPGSAPWAQLQRAGVPRRVLQLLGLTALVYGLELGGWRLIGEAALDGRLDTGWLAAWALLLLTMVPLHLGASWLNAGVVMDSGRLLKQRLLAGALRLDLDTLRQQGAGQWLGRAMEAQALESLLLGGGLGLLLALVELGFAAWVLAHGAAPGLHLPLLAGWLLLNLALAARLSRRLRDWTLQRLDATHQLVERMVGHRTRLAQDRAQQAAAEDDRAALGLLGAAQRMDAAIWPVAAAAPGGWLLLGLAGLAPTLAGAGTGLGALAISLGGVLLAHRALGGVAGGLSALARARVAWESVAPLFQAAAGRSGAAVHMPDAPVPEVAASAPAWPAANAEAPAVAPSAASRAEPMAAPVLAPSPGRVLLDAQGLQFRYRPQAEPVLRGVDLQLREGEHVLLEGDSGGGKSTLAALLTGLRRPDAGLLLIDGLDRATLGDDWHRRATAAPQFHDNHVLTGTLAYNLLMGRRWPATSDDLADAEQLCQELGLGPLLQRMPSGLQQRVGETGWQLSHGERSRVFLARALLQRAPLTVLDESFGALDPSTLQRCLATALRHSRALVVIAHP